MDEFFTQEEQEAAQPTIQEAPQQEPIELGLTSQVNTNPIDYGGAQGNSFAYEGNLNFNSVEADNQFNDFQEDQVTRKIREEQQKVQNQLKQKSDQEWENKKKRREEGSAQLEQFKDQKEEEKRQRTGENCKKEEQLREDLKKLNLDAGWTKVISNITLKQGERKGTKDINRMRESIMHKREDSQ